MPAPPINHNTTFMGVPHKETPAGAEVVILGLPFDCGIDPDRIGSRHGPKAIREQSRLISPFDGKSGINPLAELAVIDLGDAVVEPGNIQQANTAIEAAMTYAISTGAIPITLGGDGAVALPQMRALAKKYPDLVVVHIDAHTDAYPIEGYSNATPFTRAQEEALIDCQHSYHIGRRGSHMVSGIYPFTKSLGYNLIDMDELLERGIKDVFAEVRKTIADRPVYLCFDMDFFDPSVAPGVCSPTWGGATSREGLSVIKECAGLQIVAADINTVSPPHDNNGMTALLAATIAYEIMMLIATDQISDQYRTSAK